MRRTLAIALCSLPFTYAISLGNLQEISPGHVSIQCLLTYDSGIPSCTKNDFASGASCSTACITGLEVISQEVNLACHGIEVPSSSLLGKLFEGALLSLLCPNNILTTSASTQSTSTTTSKSTTTSATSTPPPPPPAVGKTTSTTTSKKTTSKTTTTSSSSTTISSSISTTSASASATISSSASLDVASSFSTSSTKSSSTTTKSATAHHTHLSEQQIQLEAVKGSGGGSPFDIDVIASGGPMQICSDSRSLIPVLVLTIVMMFGF